MLSKKGMTKMQAMLLAAIIIVAAVVAVVWVYLYSSQETELVVMCFPGQEKAITKVIAPIMLEKFNTKLVIQEMGSKDVLARILAKKEAPDISVACFDADVFYTAREAGVLEILDTEIVTNLVDIIDIAKYSVPFGTGYGFYAMGIAYNTKIFEEQGFETPTSWEDLWNSSYAGRVSIQSSGSTWAGFFLLEINRMLGADYKATVEPAFDKIKTLAPNVVFHRLSSELNTLIQQEEVWIGHAGAYRILDLQTTYPDANVVIPKEGSIVAAVSTCVVKNAPHQELAQEYVNLLISPEFQKELFQSTHMGYINQKTVLDPEYEAIYPYTEAALANLWSPDWLYLSEHWTDWSERYAQEIEGG